MLRARRYSCRSHGFQLKEQTTMTIKALTMAGLMAMALLATATAADVRMFVRHEVADYAAWRKAYDSFAPIQKKAGVYYQAVYRSADDGNDLTVIHDFHSLEQAKAFAANPELKAAMAKGGVKGAPTIWYTTRSTR
jgi:hypothetical protein